MDVARNSGPLANARSVGGRKLLRFTTCGSVDDGKSTLIGRLLHDTRSVFDDQFEDLKADSRRFGTTGEDIDLAFLLDGLQIEREQGVTIDVAYRFFSTDRRSFIVADTPGHGMRIPTKSAGDSERSQPPFPTEAGRGFR